MPRKTFANGFPLPASDLNTYLMDQSVQTYADATARTAALATPVEGQVSYLADTNTAYVYDGSSWNAVVDAKNYGATLPNGAAGRNKVINGGFDVWQRGTSFANVHAYTADRFKTDGATAVAVQTLSQLALTPNEIAGFDGAYAARLNVTNVNGATKIQLLHRVEDVRTFANQNVTLSFWAKADSARSLSLKLSQQFGSGGSSGVDTSAQTASVTTSWTRFTMTFALASIVGKTIGAGSLLLIEFSYPLSTFTIDITGVQLEAGSVATPFARAAGTLQGELAACQRYYQRIAATGAYGFFGSIANAYSTTATAQSLPLRTTMRVTPTAVDYSGTISLNTPSDTRIAVSSLSLIDYFSNPNIVGLVTTSTGLTSGTYYRLQANNDGNAYIGVSAEL